MNNTIIELVKNLSGEMVWSMITIIAISMPIWIILSELKNKWLLYRKRQSLINRTILSKGSFYEINNKKGILEEIDKDFITLKEEKEDVTNYHFIAISEAIKSISKIEKGDS